MLMLAYLTLSSGFVVKWWHVLLFIAFLITRTVWDYKRVMHQQIDFWLNQSKLIKEIHADIKEIKARNEH